MLYHIYSGQIFFTAMAALVISLGVDLSRGSRMRPFSRAVSRVVALLAVSLAAFGGTPVPLWLAIPGVGSFVCWLMLRPGRTRSRAVAGLGTIALALLAVAWEAQFHLGTPSLERPARIIVVGDSLSSGGFGESRVWAQIVGEGVGGRVLNLSRPGDTVAAAAEGQLPDVPPPAAGDLVVLAIGGNDMLGGTGAREYADDLEGLSGIVGAGTRPVVMFELPLLPGRWAYGAAQRRIARTHGITLVPKRVLAGVLLGPGNTADGLHLTQRGHDELARRVMAWAGWTGAPK